jgi:hypothetical protein
MLAERFPQGLADVEPLPEETAGLGSDGGLK